MWTGPPLISRQTQKWQPAFLNSAPGQPLLTPWLNATLPPPPPLISKSTKPPSVTRPSLQLSKHSTNHSNPLQRCTSGPQRIRLISCSRLRMRRHSCRLRKTCWMRLRVNSNSLSVSSNMSFTQDMLDETESELEFMTANKTTLDSDGTDVKDAYPDIAEETERELEERRWFKDAIQ